jgi:hypothetical protein
MLPQTCLPNLTPKSKIARAQSEDSIPFSQVLLVSEVNFSISNPHLSTRKQFLVAIFPPRR